MQAHRSLCLALAAALSLGACASTTAPAPDRPDVLSRATWGARPLDTGNASPMGGISRLTVHHTGEPRAAAPMSVDEAARRMRSYQSGHMDGRGWADIGYHFVIDPNGRVWEGRSIAWQGAHAGNGASNCRNVGISLMGNFDLQSVPPAQKGALTETVHWLVDAHGITPENVWTHQRIKREYDLPGTACPGGALSEFVERLQDDLRSRAPSN